MIQMTPMLESLLKEIAKNWKRQVKKIVICTVVLDEMNELMAHYSQQNVGYFDALKKDWRYAGMSWLLSNKALIHEGDGYSRFYDDKRLSHEVLTPDWSVEYEQ